MNKTGSTRLLLIMYGSLLILVIAGILYDSRTKRQMEICESHLHDIYTALELFVIDRGTLPDLAFFPEDPLNDPDSLLAVLAPYGVQRETGICPSVPDHIQRSGLCYIWNPKLNGRTLTSTTNVTWMIADLAAMSSNVPPPHRGHYHVLYTDGSVRREKISPVEN